MGIIGRVKGRTGNGAVHQQKLVWNWLRGSYSSSGSKEEEPDSEIQSQDRHHDWQTRQSGKKWGFVLLTGAFLCERKTTKIMTRNSLKFFSFFFHVLHNFKKSNKPWFLRFVDCIFWSDLLLVQTGLNFQSRDEIYNFVNVKMRFALLMILWNPADRWWRSFKKNGCVCSFEYRFNRIIIRYR